MSIEPGYQHPIEIPDAHTINAAGELLRALAAPVRVAIVLHLAQSPLRVHELVDALGVSQPLVSQHLRVLKSAQVLVAERHGRQIMYKLRDDHLAHIVTDAVTHVQEDHPAVEDPAAPLTSVPSVGPASAVQSISHSA